MNLKKKSMRLHNSSRSTSREPNKSSTTLTIFNKSYDYFDSKNENDADFMECVKEVEQLILKKADPGIQIPTDQLVCVRKWV